ncbi:MAG: hypothetical protein K8T10_14640 [Candidatus Eremiobacteraeota bacterium]|nr:hypothetical protein [Candidatus Eremiobacteraeota bacterium]
MDTMKNTERTEKTKEQKEMDEKRKKEEEQKEEDRKWTAEQIEEYGKKYEHYKLFADTLLRLFKIFSKKKIRLALVQARAKSMASFAEKIQRKKHKHDDPVNQLTDLCGARIITYTLDELKDVCEFIEEHFEIDRENSFDVCQRLRTSEFGYRSIHYIVKFIRRNSPPKDIGVEIPEDAKDIDVEIPEELYGLKAEIQVRTVLEHAWADFFHQMGYKKGYKIPDDIEREIYSLAAILENADGTFSRVQNDLKTYLSRFEVYMTEDKIRDEMNLLEMVHKHDRDNVKLAHRIGSLAMTLEDWQKAIKVMSKHAASKYKPLLRDLGIAIHKLYKNDTNSVKYKEAREKLEQASEPPKSDPFAYLALAKMWRIENDHEKARENYKKAFEADPTNPHLLSKYLEWEIEYNRGKISTIATMGPVIKSAIKRCNDEIGMGINLVWSYFNMGKFYLLLKQPYKGIECFAMGLQLCEQERIIKALYRSLKVFSKAKDHLTGFDWVEKLILAGWVSKFDGSAKLDDGLSPEEKLALNRSKNKDGKYHEAINIESPVFILAGWCDKNIDSQMKNYRDLLQHTFSEFRGTVISGGTDAGISGLAGKLQGKYPDNVWTIGYLPESAPLEDTPDNRYKEIRITWGRSGYSIAEPLQNWIDIIASGINPSKVKLIGVNGGTIAAAEYRIALALGAKVGILQGSGREAAILAQDEKGWAASPNLIILPADKETIKAFIRYGDYRMPEEIRNHVAQLLHESFLLDRQKSLSDDPSMKDWDNLKDDLREANRQQADCIIEKLEGIGCAVCKPKDRTDSMIDFEEFTNEEIETLAEIEHARWVVERLLNGWKYGEKKDFDKKLNPSIVEWSELSYEVQGYDRDFIRRYPEILKKVGLKIYRLK